MKSKSDNRCALYATICLSSHDSIGEKTTKDEFEFVLLKINECKFSPGGRMLALGDFQNIQGTGEGYDYCIQIGQHLLDNVTLLLEIDNCRIN